MSRAHRADVTAPTSDGKRAPRCSSCGFVGGRATGCGTSHPTQRPAPVTPPPPTPYDVAAAKARIANKAAAPAIAALEDDEPERWSSQRITEERELAEGRKHAGALPVPRSTFQLMPRVGADLARVTELRVK